jgi:hypothetical protein
VGGNCFVFQDPFGQDWNGDVIGLFGQLLTN